VINTQDNVINQCATATHKTQDDVTNTWDDESPQTNINIFVEDSVLNKISQCDQLVNTMLFNKQGRVTNIQISVTNTQGNASNTQTV
jgi:hypothetical protein